MKNEANIVVAATLLVLSIVLIPVLPAQRVTLPQNKTLIRYK